MSIQVQLRRGSSAQNSVFTGQAGELIYTTDTKELFMHDGVTAGGTNVANATHTGDVTGATTLTIANGVVDSDNLSTTLDFGSIA